MRISWWTGPREALRPSFELADDSASQLDGYLHLGRVLVAEADSDPTSEPGSPSPLLGHLQLVPGEGPGVIEIKNLAVATAWQGKGVGRALVEEALRRCRDEGATTVTVATGAADVGNLRFYQRTGFRFLSVERDAFVPETGYPEVIMIDGIQLRDRVWLSHDLTG